MPLPSGLAEPAIVAEQLYATCPYYMGCEAWYANCFCTTDIQLENNKMQVNSLLNAQSLGSLTSKSSKAEAVMSGTFMDALNAAKKNAANNVEPPAAVTKQASSPDHDAYLALIKYMKETPEQHLRDKIMKDMGVTDESLAAMPPGQRAAIEDAIAKQVKEYMLAHNQTAPQTADAAKSSMLLPS
jgi:hypothetical protein